MKDIKTYLEGQRSCFRDHVAELTEFGDVKILNFQEPGCSNYHIRFIFDEASYTLTITGDLGYLVAWNPTNMKYDSFYQFSKSPSYFRGKIRCMDRAQWEFDEDAARKELEKLFADREYNEEDIIPTSTEELIDMILEDFSYSDGISTQGFEVLDDNACDAFEFGYDLGKESSGIIELYCMAYDLAVEQLEKKKLTEQRKQNAVTRKWKVYGAAGHRQAESFYPSAEHDWSTAERTRIIKSENADVTGTNDYTIVSITCDTADECERELEGQLSDGMFENCRYGQVVEICE